MGNPTRGLCGFEGCSTTHQPLRKGFCGKHYNRLLKYGDASFTQYDGRTQHPLFYVWVAMKQRCINPNHKNYARYGGRGIKVCDEWWSDFSNFLKDMGERPTKSHSIERIDNDGDYAPENCKWATRKEQANNRRSNRIITFRGVTKTAQQWADDLGLAPGAITQRLERNNWTLERALTTRR